MNGTYYKNPTFPTIETSNNKEEVIIEPVKNQLSLIDILNNNIRKKVILHMNYQDNNDSTYSGIIEYITKDIIILSNPETGNWYLLLSKYLLFIEFEELININ